MNLRALLSLFRATFSEWWNDNTFRLAASLAFYTIFSLTPVVVVAVGLAGVVLGPDQARSGVLAEIRGLVGPAGADALDDISASLPDQESGIAGIVIGVLTLVVGSTVVFAEMQSALNHIWDVQVRPDRGFLRSLLRDRLQSFLIVLALGFVLLVSLVLTAVITGMAERLSEHLPGTAGLVRFADSALSFMAVLVLFALIYKYLPDVKIRWSDVSIGAAVTALLFTLGKHLIGAYLGKLAVTSTYGAAGSFVLFLLWVYYSALICFFGAEFTQVYARRYGSRIRPQAHAMRKGDKPDEV